MRKASFVYQMLLTESLTTVYWQRRPQGGGELHLESLGVISNPFFDERGNTLTLRIIPSDVFLKGICISHLHMPSHHRKKVLTFNVRDL